MPKERISVVGAGLTSLQQVLDLGKQTAEARVLCLHGNRIADLQGIEQLRCLTDVNLSSNEVQSFHCFQTLSALTSINLASNRLNSLQGLQSLPILERLIVSHNLIASLTTFTPQANCKLKLLDLHNNLLASTEDLSALKACANLRELMLSGGQPGNPLCSLPNFEQITAQLLPQLDMIDGQKLETILARSCAQTHHQQQQQKQQLYQLGMLSPYPQPVRHNQPLALPAPPTTLAASQQAAATYPGAAGMQSTSTDLVRAPLLENVQHGSQEDRIAALETRLRDVLNQRSRPPLAPNENLLNQPARLALAQQARKVRPKTVMHEVACQTVTGMGQLDRLQQDAAHLKEELQTLASQLEQRTSHALRVEEQAQELEQEAHHKVTDIRRQANEALQQARAEIAEADRAAADAHKQAQLAQEQHQLSKNQVAELQWELRHAWEQSQQADQAQKTALQAAQDRATKLETDCRQCHEVAARAQQSADKAQGDASRLSQELAECKAALQACRQSQARAEQELQQCNAAASRHSATAAQAATASQAELESLRRQLSSCQQESQALRSREEEARQQTRQLAAALTAAQKDYQKGLECKVQWYETQIRREVDSRESEAAKHAQQQEQLQASRDALQKQLAVTEAEFRLALQEHDRAAIAHQHQLQQQAAETRELRRGLHAASQHHQEQEGLVKELTEVLQRQKTRVAALQKDRVDMTAQLASYQPAEQDKLRAEMGTLRERVGQLAGIKDRLVQEQQKSEQLQSQVASAQASHQQAAAAAASQLAATQEALSQLKQEASEKLGQADMAAAEAECQVDELTHELEEARDAVKVKEAMMDDAQASIANLKAQLNAAQAEAAESAQALRHAEADLTEHEAEEQRLHQSLRLEIEAQEQALEQLEKNTQEATRKAHDAEQKAKSALDALKRTA
ncbi:TPA: hypothetical protein ACH3X1_015822 [Trebouxia sp. C0004]